MSANHETLGEGRDDLDWLAFQYVAGELSPAEEERFEARLAIDPEAAEAVARAVTLGEAVSLAFRGDAVSGSRPVDTRPATETRPAMLGPATANRSAVARTASVATAACVIVAALLISFRDDGAVHDDELSGGSVKSRSMAHRSQSVGDAAVLPPGAGSDLNSLLLETWTDTRESIAALDSDSLTEVVSVEVAESRADLASDVPDWLFVAVELSHDPGPGRSNGNVLEN